ncbi:MAG: thiamine pyrophosphate-dependent enzyme [Halobacteria archaeon]
MNVIRVLSDREPGETPYTEDKLLEIYEDMVRARIFDEKALSLQRRGWMSGYPPYRGQEASQVAAAHALEERDWFFPTYRSNAAQIARGVPMSDILLFRRGFPEFNSNHDVNNFTQATPIATQIPHAVGFGMASNYRDDDCRVMCYFGDGATSEGDFHEGMNFAGVFDAPVLFLCENNGWAISVPTGKQTASETIAEKAEAYGFQGVRVDGNDPLAVHTAVSDCLELAEQEPIMLESLTYRHGAHTTSDDPSKYRHIEPEMPEWRTVDPLERYGEYLKENGVLSEGEMEGIREDAEMEIKEAVEIAESTDDPEPEELFDRVYGATGPELERQKNQLMSEFDDIRGDD